MLRSRDALASADLVLLLFDLAQGWSDDDQALFALIPEMEELGRAAQLQRTLDQIRSMADVIDIARTGQS